MSHTGNKLCYIVTANIAYKEKSLLIFHKEYDMWLPVGGHIEKEEDPETALFREIYEETRLTRKVLDPISLVSINRNIFTDTKGRNLLSPLYTDIHSVGIKRMHVGMRFFFRSKRNKVVSKDPDIKKAFWFTEKDLKSGKYKMLKHVKFYGLKAIELSRK